MCTRTYQIWLRGEVEHPRGAMVMNRSHANGWQVAAKGTLWRVLLGSEVDNELIDCVWVN